MAERLGSGLQNRPQQFESAWYLITKKRKEIILFVFFSSYLFKRLIHSRRHNPSKRRHFGLLQCVHFPPLRLGLFRQH